MFSFSFNKLQSLPSIVFVSLLQTILKSFTILYFLILPILFDQKVISAEQLGYIGALFIVGLLCGTGLVTYSLHNARKSKVLQIAGVLLSFGTLCLFWYANGVVLIVAYILVGVATGLGMSTVNALAAEFTTKGMRFKSLAKMAMIMDMMRIVYPFVSGLIFLAVGIIGLIYLALFTVGIFIIFTFFYTRNYTDTEKIKESSIYVLPNLTLKKNIAFYFMVLLEFFDSFASSQLFVFLPALLVFKSYPISDAIIMQSVVFGGYLIGRWFVSALAQRFTGLIAVGIAEVGMVIIIVLLAVLPASNIMYLLCFLLGIFTRGTSPVLKALIFDQLEPHQINKGTAIYGLSGDAGGAIAQLLFGFLLAWFGAVAPFTVASVAAGLVVIGCFMAKKEWS